jgi:hypothetical protein
MTPLQFRDSGHGGISASTGRAPCGFNMRIVSFSQEILQEELAIECPISGFDSIAQVIRQGHVMVMRAVSKMVSHPKRCQRTQNLGSARVVPTSHVVGNLVGGGHATIIAHIIFRRQLHTALPRWVGARRGLRGLGRREKRPVHPNGALLVGGG